MFVRLAELGNELPVLVNRIMYTIMDRNAREVKTIGSKRFGVQALLRGIYIHNDLMYLHTSLRNLTNVSFRIDHIRFKIADRKVAKRTAVQETFIEPVQVFNHISTVDGKSTVRNVFVFQKITIPDDKVLYVEIYERGGGRHQSFAISNEDLVHAKTVDRLKLE